MHWKNPISIYQETSIYSIESLHLLMNSLEILNKYNSKLEEMIFSNEDYQKTIQMEYKSKLEIIHQHLPKWLKYFIRILNRQKD